MFTPGIVAALAGFLVVGVSVGMLLGWVPRNWAVGVRTRSTMRSDAAFTAANRAAAPATAAGGAVFAVCGLIAAQLPQHTARSVLLAGAAALAAATILGGVIGVRAARRV